MSFSTALSGLAANNTALDVVGNNLSNLNTTGFKSDAIQFKDIMGQTSGSTRDRRRRRDLRHQQAIHARIHPAHRGRPGCRDRRERIVCSEE